MGGDGKFCGDGVINLCGGILSRPVGGYFFGNMSDIRGYLHAMKLGMLLAVLLISFMAAVPSDLGQGWLAFYLMLLCRLLLGFAHGGVSAAVNVASFDLTVRRGGGVSSSLVYSMAAVGKCVSLLVILLSDLLLEDDRMYVWGWRIPLVLGAVAGLVILIFLCRMDDIAGRSALLVEGKVSGGLSFVKFSLIFFMSSGTVVCYNLWVSTAVVAGVEYFGISERKMFILSFLQTLIFSILVFVAGLRWDGENHLRRYRNFLIVLCVFSPVMLLLNFPGLHPSNIFYLVAIFLSIVPLSLVCSAIPVAVVRVMAGSSKGIGNGVPYSVAVAGLGGTAPMIRHALEDHYAVFSVYVLSCVFVLLPSRSDCSGPMLRPRYNQPRDYPASPAHR
ncbi:Alpha-ketoglutarate permease [Corynebacterium oculi]|uniref:Alpha-ketoglutarate permease n=2 Tax=Corynebacterium oculi TaxID=1544416 RepID=A0A0Q0UAZ3_9CORY|nr:Alpha-ketoglutarate permease [Corynebacterium oculi]